MDIDIELLRTMKLHGNDLSEAERKFVLQEFFKFYRATGESNFSSFKEWVTWDEKRRAKNLMTAEQAFKLVTERGLPFELIEGGLEETDWTVSYEGFNARMERHRNISRNPDQPNNVF